MITLESFLLMFLRTRICARKNHKDEQPATIWPVWSSFTIYDAWGSLKTQNGHDHPCYFKLAANWGEESSGHGGVPIKSIHVL